jgi:type IV secretory pathway TraG/TraD family ATPase VirD4
VNERRSDGFVGSVLDSLFVQIPVWISKKAFEQLLRIQNILVRCIFLIVVLFFWVSAFLALACFGGFFRCLMFSGWSGFVVTLICFYGFYVVLTFPFFLLLAYASTKTNGSQKQDSDKHRRKRVTQREAERARESAGEARAYLGSSYWTGKPFYLSDDMRLMHTHVVGSTGVGKTESVLLTLLGQDIQRGKGAIVIDAKGDLELLAKIRMNVQAAGRMKDFLFFSLSNPELSHTYNPLLRGNASQIKDKLIGASEWSDEFYKKKAEEAALTILRPMIELGRKPKFRDLYYLMTDSDLLRAFNNHVGTGLMHRDLELMISRFGDNSKFLSGLIADLALIAKSEFSVLVDVDEGEIDLLKVYDQNKIVYFSLNTQGYEETAKRFGRLILQDIKTVSNEIQTQKDASERHFFPVYVDEFSSFTYENFIEFLNKGRGAGFAITLLHQSLADLATRRTTFQQQILENTNIKIIMRQDDPFSIDKFSKIGGTRKTLISTYQTEEKMLGVDFTGEGSMREAQTFRIDPDLVRTLGRGEAIVIIKSPEFKIDFLKLDYQKDEVSSIIVQIIKGEKKQALNELKRRAAIKVQSLKKDAAFQSLFDTAKDFKQQRKVAGQK